MADPVIVFPAEGAPLAAPAPPSPNSVFRGPNGIRAGWRALIFIAITVGLTAGVNLVVYVVIHFLLHRPSKQFGAGSLTPLNALLTDGSLFVFTAIAALIMARIEKRNWGKYGLPAASAFGRDFWVGLLVGFAAISGVLFAIFLLDGFQLTGLAIHGQTILISMLEWSAAFVLAGLGEEFAFRGYLQYTLTTGMGYWPSAILLSALFGLAHAANPGESKVGLFSVVIFALIFCFILRRTGNLWWVVGFHAGWDWGQTFFYGVPDSGLAAYHSLLNSSFSGPLWLTGGSVGPEASIFTPIALVIVGFVVSLVYRQDRYVAP